MPNNDMDKSVSTSPKAPSGHSVVIALLAVGLLLALAGNAYLAVRTNHMNEEIAQFKDSANAQIAKVSSDTTAMMQQRLDTLNDTLSEGLKGANESAANAIRQARSEIKRQSTQLSSRLDEQQKQVAADLTELKDATTSASSKINEVSTDVTGVKTDVDSVKQNVASTQTEVEKHAAELKRVTGDMGVMSGLIATNSKDLSYLRELGERNYIEFNINKRDNAKKVGDIVLTLKKTDPKRNRYTVEVMADDKKTEKKDRGINEPVQLYVAGQHQPYEIVVNQVNKDSVVGYLATPKMKLARR